jgi:uncharacterized protein YdeI (BOF family)
MTHMRSACKTAVLACCALTILPFTSGGCATGSHAATLGAAPPPDAPVTAVRELAPSGPVVVQGTMIEKCPVAGCWFMLRDESGVIRVDTKAAGFVVTNVPLGTTVTVAGTLPDKGVRRVSATGLRY